MQLTQIKYNHDVIETIENNISISKICSNLGIDFTSQKSKLQLDPTYKSKLIKVQTNGGVQSVFCIPLSKLNGWLFSINPNKVKPSVRAKLIAYKEECFDVLHNHFMPHTTSQEQLGALETKLRDTKRELIELKRLHNRASYNHEQYSKPILCDNPVFHSNFLEFLYQINMLAHEIATLSKKYPSLDDRHKNMSTFVFQMMNMFKEFRGVNEKQKQLQNLTATS